MAFKKLTAEQLEQEIKPGDHWITTTSGMSGHFAVEMWLNNEEKDLGPFAEPWDTGLGRYKTPSEAEEEALIMAEELDLPYYF